MKKYNLKDMKKGWFVGAFNPSVIFTDKCELGIKKYKKGDKEPAHFHKKSDEITVILSGQVKMGGEIFYKDDIIFIEKNEITDFYAMEDTITVVYKSSSTQNDKYF